MQRSSIVNISELINILKLELSSSPTKAKESNVQRVRGENLEANKRSRVVSSDESDDKHNCDSCRDKLWQD